MSCLYLIQGIGRLCLLLGRTWLPYDISVMQRAFQVTNKYAKKDKSSSKLQHIRQFAVVGIAIGVIAVFAVGLFYSDSKSEEGYVEGVDYTLLEAAPRRRPGSPIVVTEYFSYGCIHCKNFDPNLSAWSANLPEGVVFERSPVAFSPAWEILGRTYLALEHLGILEENHSRMFYAIHDQGRQFARVDMVADFIDGHGSSKADFLEAYESLDVQRKYQKINRRAASIPVTGVPTLVVAGKYLLPSSLDRKGMLELVDYLLQKELNPGADDPA